MSDPTSALAYLTSVDNAHRTRAQLRRQAVRDARTAGAHVAEIAATLGVRNRSGVYEMLEQTPPPPTPPPPVPAIFVRGAGVDQTTWTHVIDAIHTRGWIVIRDRTQAWHLARGRVPVVLVDITRTQPRIGLVKARYGDTQQLELPAARPATLLDTLDLDQLALAIIDQLTAPTDQTPHDQKDFTPEPTTPAAKTGITTKRTMSLPELLWKQVQQAVTDGRATSASQFISDALHALASNLERINKGPFPPVDRLPTGRRTLPDRGQAMRTWSITLDQAEWARARAIVAAGAATSLPALLVRALQEHLAA